MVMKEFSRGQRLTHSEMNEIVQIVLDLINVGPGLTINRHGMHVLIGEERRRIIRGSGGGGITVVDEKADIPTTAVSALFEVTDDTTNNGLWWRDDSGTIQRIPSYYGEAAA